jgi:hypothetical protein
MIDVSRDKVPTLATLFMLVDLFAELKINQLQLYTEHTFQYANHPDVWRDASPITPAEIRQLDEYCRARFIELVPNQNSFGHMARWLKHPRYAALAEAPDGFTFRGDCVTKAASRSTRSTRAASSWSRASTTSCCRIFRRPHDQRRLRRDVRPRPGQSRKPNAIGGARSASTSISC